MSEIRWTSKTEYYDIHTGEQITKKEANKHYITLKITKHVEETIQKSKHTGHGYILKTITYTRHCSKGGKQRNLFTD